MTKSQQPKRMTLLEAQTRYAEMASELRAMYRELGRIAKATKPEGYDELDDHPCTLEAEVFGVAEALGTKLGEGEILEAVSMLELGASATEETLRQEASRLEAEKAQRERERVREAREVLGRTAGAALWGVARYLRDQLAHVREDRRRLEQLDADCERGGYSEEGAEVPAIVERFIAEAGALHATVLRLALRGVVAVEPRHRYPDSDGVLAACYSSAGDALPS